jgi:hypothetical protein
MALSTCFDDAIEWLLKLACRHVISPNLFILWSQRPNSMWDMLTIDVGHTDYLGSHFVYIGQRPEDLRVCTG